MLEILGSIPSTPLLRKKKEMQKRNLARITLLAPLNIVFNPNLLVREAPRELTSALPGEGRCAGSRRDKVNHKSHQLAISMHAQRATQPPPHRETHPSNMDPNFIATKSQ